MELDDDSPTHLLLSTREHGSVGYELPGAEDILHVKKLLQKVKKKWPGAQGNIEMYTVDEFVYLEFHF